MQTFSRLSRNELALTVCEHLDWTTPRGTLKVQSGLSLLDTLEDHGVITLPPKRVTKAPVRRVPTFTEPPDSRPVEGPLASVTPIALRLVTTPADRARWKAYLQTYHYLGYRHPFGAHLGYLIVSEPRQQELGGFVFAASAAWALAPRDQWIGWDTTHRQKLLSLVLSNDRFVIFPWVTVPNLASHVLSLATTHIADDWGSLHGYRPVLIETFVDPTRYSGTGYQAANWTHLGQTQGRGRDDPRHACRETKKDIYVYPLRRDWRQCLTPGHRQADRKKRYRNDLASSHTRSVGEAFITLWEHVVTILHEVAAEYDAQWRVRTRVIDSMILLLLIFRLVSSKHSQGYGTTIDDLWDSCDRLQISLPQKSSIAPSSFCAARTKLDVRRPQFSWTRIKGESDVKGGGGHGWVEASAGSGVGADPAAVGAGGLAPGQRWSASRKRDVVLRLLRGESLDAVSREVGLEFYRLEAWQARALAGLELGLKAQAGEPLAAELDAATRHIGELSMEIELLRERARAAERRLPLATRRSRR